MIFRDDDIQKGTAIERFILVDSLFIKHKVIHTIAVICEGIEQHTELVKYINSHSHIDVQLHCFNHIDFSKASEQELHEQFSKGRSSIQNTFGVTPHTFYPPWNRANEKCIAIAAEYGLTVSTRKISFETYIIRNGVSEDKTINFHYWHDDLNLIECALRIHKRYLLGETYPL